MPVDKVMCLQDSPQGGVASATTALAVDAEASPLPFPHPSMLRASRTTGSCLGALFFQGAFPCPSIPRLPLRKDIL